MDGVDWGATKTTLWLESNLVSNPNFLFLYLVRQLLQWARLFLLSLIRSLSFTMFTPFLDEIAFALEQNGVAGTLPFELSSLQTLENLILEEGILTGTIPSKLGEIRSLEQIDLNFNLLQGPIPEELYTLSNLRQMDLNDNELMGTISSSISNLAKMSFFQIENNAFTGTVPASMAALTALRT